MSPNGSEYKPEWASKIDVARRQLSTAIRLFFEQRDPVAVHTLVAASHQILADLGDAAGVLSLLKGSNKTAEFIRKMNYAANFFKHADNDPDGRINIEPLGRFTAEFLMDAVVLLQRLTNELPIEGKIFWMWFVKKNRELFEGSGDAIQQLIDSDVPDDFSTLVALLTFHDLQASTETGSTLSRSES
jgi:hypothetical protein